MKHITGSVALGAGLLCLFATAAPAAEAAVPFYRGKDIRMVIASGAGGGYDVYARVLSRTLAKYIPGNPTIIDENMPGASGLNATNWTFAQAPKDGTIILSTYNALLLEPLLGNKKTAYEPAKFQWVGSIGKQQQVCMTWHTSPVKTIEDAKTRTVTVAATGATGNSAVTPNIVNAMLGTKFKVIGGYTTSDSRLAVERGEVEGICGLAWSTLKASNPDWIEKHRMNVLLQTGAARQAELPDVPLLAELARSEEDRKVLSLLQMPEDIGRPFAMPPDTPDEAVTLIRRAFEATMKDKDFLAAAQKAHLEVAPMSGADMESRIVAAYATPTSLVERAASLMGHEGKGASSKHTPKY